MIKDDIKFSLQAGIFFALAIIDVPGQNHYDGVLYCLSAFNFLQSLYHNHKLGYS